eukprot:CAMPEP_0179284310 /NCGR_PEP_ID=MMETSP0797-20121207/38621_1 /TAXON_ID=47934 /ORGANISM="Dinophysis acuminata, Strain DAEP01" /LENGTH=70 /DNA_ID=CAMNT_0020993081 /DNA_START=61 /DNA_END=270 /DNA_ORIENTATION=+
MIGAPPIQTQGRGLQRARSVLGGATRVLDGGTPCQQKKIGTGSACDTGGDRAVRVGGRGGPHPNPPAPGK